MSDQYRKHQIQQDIKRLKKVIAELEVTARHFKVGDTWQDVVELRNKLLLKLNILEQCDV